MYVGRMRCEHGTLGTDTVTARPAIETAIIVKGLY